MHDEKQKIIRLIKLLPIGGVISISIILVIVSIIGINKYFNDEAMKMEKKVNYETIYEAKKMVKNVYSISSNIAGIIKKSYKREIRMSVNLGYLFMKDIYEENKNLPKHLIINKIKSKLSKIRFYNDKSGYYFIYDLNGNTIMLPIKPSLEGKNLWNYRDIKGKYVIRDVVNCSKKYGSCFEEWYYYKPNTNIVEKKLGYVRFCKRLGLVIGSAVYFDNIKKEINKRLLQIISRMNFSANKNIDILSVKGDVLYSNDRSLLNQNVYQKYKNIINLAKITPHHLFTKKIKNEMIIFSYDNFLDILIMDRIDVNVLKKMINEKRAGINKVVESVINQFLTASLIFVIIIFIITFYATKLIENLFNKYEKTIFDEKKKAEEAARVKSEFLANMSHEIRTPLNAMFGFIKILQDKKLDNESKKYLNIVEKSGESLLTIINDILDFSKIESGKFCIEHIEFNPKEEIYVIHELFETKAKEKGIKLYINEINLKYNVITDPTRIKQVIANLLSNAIKFTPSSKKIILNIKYDEIKEELFIEVIDEGIGIPKEKLNTIFDAFSQADNSTTRKYGGTGLGLTISYKLSKLLGGELKVDSEVKKGSRFYFKIPAKKASIAQDVKKDEHKIDEIKFNFHLLVVEDNAANQMFMKVILQKMGISFDIANNGMEAVEKFKNNRYDLILMDENMPKMNGIEATKKIRELEKIKHLHHTTIIALTANALEGDKDRFILAGMDYYLSKPLDIDKLKKIFLELKNKRKRK